MHTLALLLSLWSPPVRPVRAVTDVASAARVLHGWDLRRERAWASSSPAALRSLYVARSPPAAADVALCRAYRARHLVVRRIETQVFALRVLVDDRTHLSVRVLDRVAGGEVDDGRRTRPLGTTAPVAQVVDLRRVRGEWKVASVRPVSDSGRDPRRARPARPGR